MVLSLAFILAFIGSAVALLIGIIIYSEVSDDMAQTFEVIEISNTSDGVWEWREHKTIQGFTMIGTAEIEVASPNRVQFNSNTDNTIGKVYLLKTFPRESIEGNDVKVTYQITTSGNNIPLMIFEILDGAYDSTSFEHFQNTGVSPFTGTRLLQGNGVLASTTIQASDGITTDTLTPSIGTEDFITIFVTLNDSHTQNFQKQGFIEKIEIVGVESITFDSNTILSAVGGSGQNEFGTFTATPTDPNAFFEAQIPEAFAQANNVALTVLAILPVALFFALFSIFGGRTE